MNNSQSRMDRAASGQAPAARKLRLLIADDSAEFRQALITFLSNLAHVELVGAARDGREAVDLAGETRPDLVLLDFQMPGLNGLQALKRIRENHPRARVIIVTMHDREAVEALCRRQGADDFLSKHRLYEELPRVLGGAPRAATTPRAATAPPPPELAATATGVEPAQLAVAVDHATDVIMVTDAKGTIQYVNPAFERITGYSRAEALGRNPRLLKSGRQDAAFYQHLWRTITAGEVWSGHFVNRRKDGAFYEEEASISPVRDTQGRVTHFISVKQDVTARRRAETALAQSEQKYRRLFETSRDAVMTLFPPDWLFASANPATVALFGAGDEAQFISLTPWQVSPERQPDGELSPDKARRMIATALENGALDFEWTHRRLDGTTFPATVRLTRIELDGRTGLQATVRDVTDLKQTERRGQAQARMAAALSAATTVTAAGEAILAAADEILGWDAAYLHLHDAATGTVQPIVTKDTVAGRKVEVGAGRFVPEPGSHFLRVLREGRQLTLREGPPPEVPKLGRFGDATRLSASLMHVPVRAGADMIGVFSIQSYTPRAYDAAALELLQALADHCAGALRRLRAEVATHEREAHFRTLIEYGSDIIMLVGLNGTIHYGSPSIRRVVGYEPTALMGTDALALVHPEDQPRARAALGRLSDPAGGPETETLRVRQPNGAWRTLEVIGTRNGRQAGEQMVVLNARDVTELRELEGQFRQSQKMEAFGQLAGGVAHDFNNLLAVLLMHTELIGQDPALPAKLREGFEQIQHTVERAANLTRQLLVFSRRQVLQTRDLDLNESVAGLTKMLRRIIGEDVALEVQLAPAPLITRADPGMMDQVLLNLAVNARDAMPRGGRLWIETAAVEVNADQARAQADATPGRYASLSVRDNGVGIARDILPRIFEPFFTTKEAGKGTGLGLATVFGIVKQHRGWIQVESEPGRGTRFQVFLPAAAAGSAPTGGATGRRPARPGTETILLAEDEAAVRRVTRLALERAGYRVLEAADGTEALRLAETHRGEVALLVTDLVMPGGMSGNELARQLLAAQPGLKVVFVSGYSPDIAGRELELRPGDNFCQKPCAKEELLATVRRSLDA